MRWGPGFRVKGYNVPRAKSKKVSGRRQLMAPKTKKISKDTAWHIGCDPGFAMTGLTLIDPQGTVAAFSSFNSPPNDDTIGRTAAMGNAIVTHILKWVWQFDIDELRFGIEVPVMKHNVATFMLQIRLMQEIESGLYHLVAPELKSFYVYEVFPTESKMLATGDGKASKGEIITACPLLALWAENPMSKELMEAIADSWAHSLITYKDQVVRHDLVNVSYVPCHQTSDVTLVTTSERKVSAAFEPLVAMIVGDGDE